MRSSRILLFLFTILVMLGCISWAFPDEGIRFSRMKLSFPSKAAVKESILSMDSIVPVLSPEELMALHVKEVKNREAGEFFSDFLKNGSFRLYFPNDAPEMLDSFFDALDSASVKGVRIAHYGDSQLEEDRITSVYREKLQKRFGGGGVGMVPLMMLHPTLSMRQTRSDTLHRSTVYGSKFFSVLQGRYGPMGQASRIHYFFSATFMPTKKNDADNPSRYFTRATILSGNSLKPLTVVSKSAVLKSTDESHCMTRNFFEFADSTEVAGFSFSGASDVYGVMFDSQAGVSVDNIAMRGCSGTVFTALNKEQLEDYFINENVGLIVLQFGGNSIPYRKTGTSVSEYGKTIYAQICHLKSIAPDAAFIFIGPSDMARYSEGHVRAFPNLDMMVDTLKHYSNKAGAAYWDLRQVMGGENSMIKWAETGYAGKDYIHFTQKGAEYVGNVFYDCLETYYNYYKWREVQK